MPRVLVECLADPASRTIARPLRQLAGFEPDTERTFESRAIETSATVDDVVLVTIEGLHIHAEDLDARLREQGIEPDVLVFLSKHKSASGHPSLTVHPLGNWADADFGGRPRTLDPTAPGLMTQTLRALARARDLEGYAAEVTFEATHHGPRLESPAFFVELGSDATAWEDPTGGRTVARAVHEALRTAVPDYPVAVGLGGGHYAPRFTEAALTRRVHYGHLWPRYHMNDRVDVADLLAKAVAATPGCTGVHIHDGTVPRTLRPAFDEAMRALGMEPLESARWEAAGPEKELRRAHQ